MKKIISVLFVFICSCSPQSKEGNEVTTDGDFNIKVIDGCQYIEYDNGIFDQRVYSLTHKGNCNNPIHNQTNSPCPTPKR